MRYHDSPDGVDEDAEVVDDDVEMVAPEVDQGRCGNELVTGVVTTTGILCSGR